MRGIIIENYYRTLFCLPCFLERTWLVCNKPGDGKGHFVEYATIKLTFISDFHECHSISLKKYAVILW